jgi:Spy/CpxP family protein refolding chaperone
MRAEGLRHALVILIAGCGLGVGSAPAADSGVDPDAPQAGADAVREPGPDGPEVPGSPRARQPRNLPPDEWWAHAREVLVEDLELSEEQTHQIDAIIKSQNDALRRSQELRSELRVAQQQADKERSAALQAKLRANREEIKRPQERIEEMRAILREEQRPGFDMNRARLVAEGQQQREKRRGRRPGAGAAVAE